MPMRISTKRKASITIPFRRLSYFNNDLRQKD
jgi:hypothetical protein